MQQQSKIKRRGDGPSAGAPVDQTQHERIERAVRLAGKRGLNNSQIELELQDPNGVGPKPPSITPARSQLTRSGKLILTGEQRPSPLTGHNQDVVVAREFATPKQVEYHKQRMAVASRQLAPEEVNTLLEPLVAAMKAEHKAARTTIADGKENGQDCPAEKATASVVKRLKRVMVAHDLWPSEQS